MNKKLLDFSEGLYIAKPRKEVVCSFSGEIIPAGCDTILIQKFPYNPTADSLDHRDPRPVWIDLDHREELEETLSSFDFESKEPREEIAGDILFVNCSGSYTYCPICENHITHGSESLSIHNYTEESAPTVAWIHKECIPFLCGGLGDMGDYYSEILAAQI